MKHWTRDIIAEIKNFTQVTFPALIAAQSAGISESMYFEKRVQLNSLIVQALIGAEMKATKKGDFKLHFNKKLPTEAEVYEIASLLDDFISKYETSADDDSAIPHIGLTVPEKTRQKDLKAMVLNGQLLNTYFNGIDCVAIAAMGEDARKRRNIKLAIIIGSSIAVAAGVTIGGVIWYNKTHDDGDDIDGITDIPDVESEDVPILDDSISGLTAC